MVSYSQTAPHPLMEKGKRVGVRLMCWEGRQEENALINALNSQQKIIIWKKKGNQQAH